MKQRSTAMNKDITSAAFEALVESNGGYLSPRLLVDTARDPASPFHDYFVWDDSEAGDLYRLAQAGQYIRRWKGSIMRIDSETKIVHIEPVRRAQSPAGQRSKGGESYQTIETIMADPVKRDDMLNTVLRELSAYRRRYAQLEALADVWRAIDDAIELLAPVTPKAATNEKISVNA